ncbi:MAG: cyanophycin synthetase [Patescibacteria group bacterium]|nr:cyanophycin synthetase [Patescibacteria group bacterium]
MISIIRKLKSRLYFGVASYFRFFANIQLQRWHPQIIVVTGSNGKTSTLHLLKSVLGNQAHFSDRANSAFGIPFDILGLKRTTFKKTEWIKLFFQTPGRAFKSPYPQKIYVVEADCDRPYEGQFLAGFLQPWMTIWLSSDRTHTQNFDRLVGRSRRFQKVESAIAWEFGHFLAATTNHVIVNRDNPEIMNQLSRTQAQPHLLSLKDISDYTISPTGTSFSYLRKRYNFSYLLPKVFGYSLMATIYAAQILRLAAPGMAKFELPPSRSSILQGVKKTTIIDSSYNANLASTRAILEMTSKLKTRRKWIILGDLIEQGQSETADHLGLIDPILANSPQKIILVGPRLRRTVYTPLVKQIGSDNVISFLHPRNALDYIQAHLQGEETLIFKGARFLEGIIEHLLAHPKDVAKLCRREALWQTTRRRWEL